MKISQSIRYLQNKILSTYFDTCDTCDVLQGDEKVAHDKAFKEAITTMQKDIELAKKQPRCDDGYF